ncbi:hypothetical protein [Mucilaginibacter paludis]|uniref:UDP-N-acetylglucosamine 2-epimerase n=1 Tax=Mucilaginibacter paludis DSM 18603 TaxID=714943 RepID=H1Y9P6_9SPHI|nr:hypothetical protein [Mucilaginibacter paludis]EHQ30548.1 hypothetical protein Mucpa_6495 [Mucilaginibacter paludis DSM 18603]
MRKKILFTTGSPNQTIQMHQISRELPEYDCWFSHLFTDSPIINTALKHTTIINGSALGNNFKEKSECYLRSHNLQIDYRAEKHDYDLVVFCSDLIIPKRMTNTKTVWVQEGMVDKFNVKSKVVKALGLPLWLSCDTSLNGSSNICDVYCTASPGYKNYFEESGTDAEKIIVTGMPNYDNLQQFTNNDFPYHGYVMVATTDMRETYRFENRPAFIKRAVAIANGRPMLFKLHPNEKFARAQAEIKKYAPANTMIFQAGNTNEMIANCEELITQYSTVVYTGIALGKKVHSYFNIDDLKRLAPIQNGGTSSRNIANVCRSFAEFKGAKEDFAKKFKFRPVLFKYTDSSILKAASA